MAESKPEIKYFIPEININIDYNNPKDSPSGLNKLFAKIKNIENMHNNSLIMTELSNSTIRAHHKFLILHFWFIKE